MTRLLPRSLEPWFGRSPESGESPSPQWWISWGVGALVFFSVFSVYWVTISPTTSFWDSGEFIAAAHTMGLPHPPGTPLYVVVGRLFSLLPFPEKALGVNLFSALSGALAILFLHLTVVHIVWRWRGPETGSGLRLAAAQLSGVTAGLFAAFGNTYWTNCVEAEVYAPSAFLTSLTTWLVLKWADDPARRGSRNLLLVVAYLLALGIGYHLGTYLMAPCFLLFILVVEPRALTPQLLGWFLGLTVLGLSIHFFILIRSAHNPAIDENNPENWRNFWYYVSRKQYKPVSILQRQAPFSFQFDHFWRYFSEQLSVVSAKGFVLPLLGIVGLVGHALRDRRTFILIGSVFLVTGLGLIIYMNFTASEVRERDYFYALAFFTFAIWMGMGLGLVVEEIALLLSGQPVLSRIGAGAFAGLSLFLAVIPVTDNFHSHDRRGDFNAHDYGQNMLIGLEDDAIIFTNGDNDTFPLWFVQEVKGFRKDVRVVNLSLLNTDWYIWQLKNTVPKVPMSIPDEHLSELRPIRTRDGRVYYVRDLAMWDIINTTAWSRPIYFAVTVPRLDEMGLLNNLVLEGLVFRLVREKTQDLDLGLCAENMWQRYRYRGLLTPDGRLDEDVYRDPNTTSLVTNYSAAHVRMAMAHSRDGRYQEAVTECERSGVISPHYGPYLNLMGPIYAEAEEYRKAEEFLQGLIELEPGVPEHHLNLAFTYEQEGRIEEALASYRRAAELGPHLLEAYRRLAAQLLRLGRGAEAVGVLESWLALHPDDEAVERVISQLRSDLGAEEETMPILEDTLGPQPELEYQTVPGRDQ